MYTIVVGLCCAVAFFAVDVVCGVSPELIGVFAQMQRRAAYLSRCRLPRVFVPVRSMARQSASVEDGVVPVEFQRGNCMIENKVVRTFFFFFFDFFSLDKDHAF